MREAIGGSFLFYLVIIFLGVYIGVLMFALTYVKAFRMKNQVIAIIEKNEGYTLTAREEIDSYFRTNRLNSPITADYCNRPNEVYDTNGFCVLPHKEPRPYNTTYYTIRTFITWDIPILGPVVNAFRFSVSGQTIIIYEGNKAPVDKY